MQGRRGGEEVGVGLVLEGFVEVVGVAGEGQLGDDGRGAVEVVGVALGLGTGKVGGVQGVKDVVKGFGVGGDGGDSDGELGLNIGLVLAGGGCEDEALVGVVADHDLQALVELSTSQQLSGKGRQEVTVNDRSVGEATVGGQADGDCVGELQSFGRELARLFDA